MTRIVSLAVGFALVFALWSGAFEFGRADAGSDHIDQPSVELAQHPYRDTLFAQADVPSDAGLAEGAAAAPAPAPSSPVAAPTPTAAPEPQASDVGVMTKLYKSGSFFALGVMVVFVGLSIWSRLDKKHAFYIAAGLGGVGLLVDAIRKGDTPNATSVMTMLMTTGGIMIAGPGHVKATPS